MVILSTLSPVFSRWIKGVAPSRIVNPIDVQAGLNAFETPPRPGTASPGGPVPPQGPPQGGGTTGPGQGTTGMIPPARPGTLPASTQKILGTPATNADFDAAGVNRPTPGTMPEPGPSIQDAVTGRVLDLTLQR